jgi:hypothetical protein
MTATFIAGAIVLRKYAVQRPTTPPPMIAVSQLDILTGSG